MKRIILFGGSFDPIHNGHIFIAKRALEFIKGDKVVFIISKNPRWKKAKNNEIQRLDMLKLALENEPMLDYSDIELNLSGGGHYTIDTIKEILKKDKKNGKKQGYFFLIGEDQLENLHKWYQIDELIKLVKFIVYKRNNKSEMSVAGKANALKYSVMIIEGETYQCSSTGIRELQSINVDDRVLKYIVDNHLYKYDEIYQLIDQKRYLHSVSVAFLAKKIAKTNKIDEKSAFIAGILHDVGKDVMSNYAYIETEWSSYKDYPLKVLHQFVGASIAKHQFSIFDEDILNSIAYHCSGRARMSKLERLIYACDKIDPLRDYDSSELIEKCFRNIEEGFRVVLEENKTYLEKKSINMFNTLTKECLEYYLK